MFGGSLGARSINIAALDAFAAMPVPRAPHQRRAETTRSSPREHCRPGYDLREYLHGEQFADALAAADLVIARSGGSVFEIAAQGLPSILVPYPHAAGDHQSANARWMADAGAALVITDGELSGPVLGEAVSGLLSDPERMTEMGRAAFSLARPDAALDVARELLRAAGS